MLRSWTTAVTVKHVKLLKKQIRASVQLGVRLRLPRAAVYKSPVGNLAGVRADQVLFSELVPIGTSATLTEVFRDFPQL